jgi:hypothetical protein
MCASVLAITSVRTLLHCDLGHTIGFHLERGRRKKGRSESRPLRQTVAGLQQVTEL